VNFCTSCGTPRSNQDNFCEKCGKNFNSKNSGEISVEELSDQASGGKTPGAEDENSKNVDSPSIQSDWKLPSEVSMFSSNVDSPSIQSDWKLPSEVLTFSIASERRVRRESSKVLIIFSLTMSIILGASAWFLVDGMRPGESTQNIEIPENLPPSSPKKSDNFALACAAWSKGDNRTFAEYLALLVKEGSKYQEFVNVGFEHVTPHMTNPNGTGPSVYDLQQNINARNRILSAYCN
jgi:hypothetical protein